MLFRSSMQQQVPVREVNQHLSKYIEMVESGEEVIITKRGKPVARLSAIESERTLTEAQQQAYARVSERMNSGYHLGGSALDRDQLHER